MPESPLNVLLLAGRFEVRGSSAYTLRLARHLSHHGVVPQVVCSNARSIDPALRSGLPLREYSHMLLPLWGNLVMHWMRRELEGSPPDLIHIQSRRVLRQGAWLARRLNRPYIVTIHDFLAPREKLRVDPRWCRKIIAVSSAVQTELVSRGNLPIDLVTVIHSGVDAPDDVDQKPVLDPGHVPVIGTAGPLEATKGLPFFLGAAQRVLTTRKNVEFLIAGAGPEEENLRRLARELKVSEHVTFVPNMGDFSHALMAMDVFCLPSLKQGLGTIMLEAMALGKPVIATGVGGVYSVIENNETGFVVPAADSEQLAQRMLQLLDDPVKARAMGEAGRVTVQNEFGVERMVAETVDVYHSAAGTSQPVPAVVS